MTIVSLAIDTVVGGLTLGRTPVGGGSGGVQSTKVIVVVSTTSRYSTFARFCCTIASVARMSTCTSVESLTVAVTVTAPAVVPRTLSTTVPVGPRLTVRLVAPEIDPPPPTVTFAVVNGAPVTVTARVVPMQLGAPPPPTIVAPLFALSPNACASASKREASDGLVAFAGSS